MPLVHASRARHGHGSLTSVCGCVRMGLRRHQEGTAARGAYVHAALWKMTRTYSSPTRPPSETCLLRANRLGGADGRFAGGNQRDIDRERARKRAEKAGMTKKSSDSNDGQLLKNKQEEYVPPDLRFDPLIPVTRADPSPTAAPRNPAGKRS